MAYQNAAAFALDGGDPRVATTGEGIMEYSRRALKGIHDPSVTIEEYMHWAKVTRAEEEKVPAMKTPIRRVLGFGGNKEINGKITESSPQQSVTAHTSGSDGHEKKATPTDPPAPDMTVVSDAEWHQASRAMRTASWGAIFYLITTDVLGPYSVPWALSQMGYGPGISLYTVFGALAGLTGYYMWKVSSGTDQAGSTLRR